MPIVTLRDRATDAKFPDINHQQVVAPTDEVWQKPPHYGIALYSKRVPVAVSTAINPTRRACTLALILLVVAAFLLGGGARDNVLSLVVLRPIAAAGLVIALALVPLRDMRRHWPLFVLLIALLLLTILQVVPLPPAIYSRLGGQQLAVDVLDLIKASDVWKPLSIAPFRSWNAIFSLLLPLAVLVLSCGADENAQSSLVKVLLALGLLSALLGIFQVIGEPGGILYLYRVTNENDAVGLFANRNHQAFFLACLLPLLSFVAAMEGVEPGRALLQRNLAILVGIALLPLILITGSRGGLALTLVGLAAALFLYRPPSSLRPARRRATRVDRRYVVYGGALFLIAILAFLTTRSNSLDRLFVDETNVTSRSEFWPYLGQIIRDFLPFGSGNGSFVEAYEIYEPDALLNPRYLNHAHNDFLEIAITAGIPGIVLVASAVLLWAWAALRVFRAPNHRSLALPRIAAVVTGMLIMASIGDYPLRTPSLAAFFAFMAVVLYRGARYRDKVAQRIGPAHATVDTGTLEPTGHGGFEL